MKTREAARSLATRLVATSRSLGSNAAALVTDMSWPLGGAVGNALEVREACETLHGGGPADTRELTLELAAEMLRLAGVEKDTASAMARATRTLDSGAAWERFLALVRAQGGDVGPLEAPETLHPAPVVLPVPSPADGVVAACDCFAVGELVVALGGGRRAKEDAIDPRVGLVVRARRGDRVRRGEAIAELHLAAPEPAAVTRAAECFRIDASAPATNPLVLERIG